MRLPGRATSLATILVLALLTGGAAAGSVVTAPAGFGAVSARSPYSHGGRLSAIPSTTPSSTIPPISTTTSTTLAGSGGPLVHPTALAVSPTGLLYVLDSALHEVFVRLPSGQFKVVAGDGTSGFSGDGGLATDAELSDVTDIAFSPVGDLYLADGPRVREVNHDGIIATVAGDGGTPKPVVGGTPAHSASLSASLSIAFGPNGVLYISTSNQTSAQSQLLRLSANDTLDVIQAVVASGPGPTGPLDDIESIAVDPQRTIYAGSTFAGWSVYKITPQGVATYLGYARRSGGNTTIVQAGPDGVIEVDDGPSILQVQGSPFTTAYNFENAKGIKDFIFVSYFAIGPNGTLYADNLNGPFDPYQQIVQVANGQATSLWQGSTGPR